MAICKEDKLDQVKGLVEVQAMSMEDSPPQHLFQLPLPQAPGDPTTQQPWLTPEPRVLAMAPLGFLVGEPALVERLFREQHSKQLLLNMEQQQQLQELGPTNQGTDKEQGSPRVIFNKIFSPT